MNIAVTSLWALLSGDDYKVMLLIQALAFSAAAFLASVTVAALHGRRAALLLFALLLVFAEPYLPTMLSETNGIIFGTLACVGLILGLYRGSLFSYCFGALFLAIGLAIRPSALFVLPGVVVAGSAIFGSSRVRRLLVAGCLCAIVLLPSAVSVLMNKTMSHGDGALNGNLSYTVYGLVTGGKGWEQYDKDNPAKLKALPEGERSAIILEASRRYFEEHPIDLFRGLAEAQLRGPLQTFAQIVRLAFLGAAGDPLRIIRPAAIAAISLLFAGVLLCQWSARKRTAPPSGGLRLFWVSISIGYLISIPFFYKDGGLRVHAVMLPMLSYMLLRALLPSASTDASAGAKADRVLKANAIFGAALILLAAWIAAMHPSSRNFQVVAATDGGKDNEVLFQYKSGWPQCDLHRFDHAAHDNRRRWFSGAIPDDDYRSAGIKEISGTGRLYFGFDASSRDWKIIHTEVPVGPLNIVRMGSTARFEYGDDKYRDYYSATNVQIVSPDQAR